MEVINTEVFAGVTVLHLLIAVTVLFIIGIVLQSFRKEKETGEALMVNVRCPGCGWTGRMSKHQRKCPQCNTDIVHS